MFFSTHLHDTNRPLYDPKYQVFYGRCPGGTDVGALGVLFPLS